MRLWNAIGGYNGHPIQVRHACEVNPGGHDYISLALRSLCGVQVFQDSIPPAFDPTHQDSCKRCAKIAIKKASVYRIPSTPLPVTTPSEVKP